MSYSFHEEATRFFGFKFLSAHIEEPLSWFAAGPVLGQLDPNPLKILVIVKYKVHIAFLWTLDKCIFSTSNFCIIPYLLTGP